MTHQFSYVAAHTTNFSGGDPTYLGQMSDISLSSPLLTASPPDMYFEDPFQEPTHLKSSCRLLPIRPKGLLPFKLDKLPAIISNESDSEDE